MRRMWLLAGSALAAVVFVVVTPGKRGFFDVGVYHGAVRYWLDGGHLYDFLSPGTVYGFTYPPFAALVLSPLAPLPWHAAIAASIVVNVAAGALVVWWLVDGIARERGWNRWYAWAFAVVVAVFLAPVRDTVSFGQVNLVLLALVWWDATRATRPRPLSLILDLSRRNARFGATKTPRSTRARTGSGVAVGVGVGLAAAVKLTPGLFVVYLLVARRWRAAAVAAGVAGGATLLAAAVAPDASRTFWTEALWNTGRIGDAAYISNQSLRGMVERLHVDAPGLWWLAAVALVGAVWLVRARRAALAGDHATGFALTAVATCLISPVTWVHHLVWLLPAMALMFRSTLDGGRALRRGALGLSYLLLCTSAVWLWPYGGLSVGEVVGGNAYVWIALWLLVAVPVRPAVPAPDGPAPALEESALPLDGGERLGEQVVARTVQDGRTREAVEYDEAQP